jgi:lysophospholipase L1-like esterase
MQGLECAHLALPSNYPILNQSNPFNIRWNYLMKIQLLALSCLIAFSFTGISGNLKGQETPKSHDAIQPVPRDGGWMKRHDSMNERVAQGNVDLVFIGDSITQGWEGRGKQIWADHYGDRNAVNLGIGGDRTQHVIWRLQNGNIQGIAPKAAVIMIGTNNSGSNTPEQIAEGVTEIVKILRDKTPQTQILLLGTFPRGANKDDARRIVNEKSNEIVSKLASDSSVHYLDIGKKFLNNDQTLSKDIMPDLLHLSEQGYQIWADSIESSLKSLLQE